MVPIILLLLLLHHNTIQYGTQHTPNSSLYTDMSYKYVCLPDLEPISPILSTYFLHFQPSYFMPSEDSAVSIFSRVVVCLCENDFYSECLRQE